MQDENTMKHPGMKCILLLLLAAAAALCAVSARADGAAAPPVPAAPSAAPAAPAQKSAADELLGNPMIALFVVIGAGMRPATWVTQPPTVFTSPSSSSVWRASAHSSRPMRPSMT